MKNIYKILLSTFFAVIMMTTVNAKTVNITDFGAIPNDGIDDSLSIENALSDLVENGGGTLLLPSGEIDMSNPIRMVMNSGNYQIVGDNGSVIRLNGDSSTVFFDFREVMRFEIKSVVFAGDAAKSFDASNLIKFDQVKHASIIKCTFFNIGASEAVVSFKNSVLSIEDTVFIGSGATDSTIKSDSSLGLSVVNSVFENTGEYRGQNANKTLTFSQMAWVHIANPDAEGVSAKSGNIRIKDSKFASGALYAFCIDNQGSAQLSGVSVTLNPNKNARGVNARNITHLDVSSTSFSANGRGRSAFYLRGNSYLLASGLILYNNAIIGDLDGNSERNIVHCVGCVQQQFRRR